MEAIFRADDNGGTIEQIAGNVGEIGRKYSLTINDDKNPGDEDRILVVDSHLENKSKVALYDEVFEKEYLLCYPLAKCYVITVHIVGQNEADENTFKIFDEANRQLFSAVNDLLGGELV